MSAVHIAIIAIWVVFWIYWLGSAFGANASRGGLGGRGVPLRALTGILVVLFLRLSTAHGLRTSSLAIHSPVIITLGFVLLVAGLAFAVWARIHLGRNWGMPMTQRATPELITSGP
jgi:protein-S-isoprenylcysteine O-methyltransferase Ste14